MYAAVALALNFISSGAVCEGKLSRPFWRDAQSVAAGVLSAWKRSPTCTPSPKNDGSHTGKHDG